MSAVMPAQRVSIAPNGQSLFDARVAKDWSLDELSAECGVSKAQLSDLERGRKGTTQQTLTRIANALGVDVSTLI